MASTERLLVMPQAEALMTISRWFEDCQQHLDLGRPGDPPAAPFTFEAAWIVTRLAAGALGKPPVFVGVDLASRPDMTAEVPVRRATDGSGGIEILATQEWFDRKAAEEGDHEVGTGGELLDLLCGPGIARPIGIVKRPDGATS